jgi:hypothetical protein
MLGYSFDTDNQIDPLATKPANKAAANPLAQNALAGLGTSFDSIFGSATPAADAANAPPASAPSGTNATAAAPKATPQGPRATDPWSAPTSLAGQASPTPTPTAAPSTSGASAPKVDYLGHFTNLLQQTTTAADPQQQAALQDKLARDVATALKGEGHDVKWQGDQLIVDGRPYVVNGGASAGSGGGASDPGTYSFDTSGSYEQGGITGDQAPQVDPTRIELPGGTAASPAPPPSQPTDLLGNVLFGSDTTKLQNPGDSVKYNVLAILKNQPTTHEGLAQVLPQIQAKYPGTTVSPDGESLTIPGVGKVHVGGDGIGWRWNPKTDAAGNRVAQQGFDLQGNNLWGPGSPYSPAQQAAFQANGGIWHGETPDGTTSSPSSLYDTIFGHTATTNVGSAPGPAAPPASAPWAPTAPGYAPGAPFDNSDLSGTSMDEILSRLESDPNSEATRTLVAKILANPESMDPHTVDMMKAASKDELASLANSDDENLRTLGYQTGNQDSNWLASERLARRGERDNALVSSNRAIEMEAAKTNAADRRAAAELGFKSVEAHRAAVQMAADTQLRAAAIRGDRKALEETFRQKATELGQSADKLRQDFIVAQMDDLTRRYGIDVGASIDRAKLAQAGEQFQQDLIFRIMALQQADAQFGADYGLRLTQTEHAIDQDMWNRVFPAGS